MAENGVEFVQKICDDNDVDIFAFSGPIYRDGVNRFLRGMNNLSSPRKNVWLFLTTPGGDADAAFQLARFAQRRYSSFTLIICGPCKSAGTLVALGANALVMTEFGELGPLDVQTRKPDELMQLNSGLDIFEGLAVISNQAFRNFEGCWMDMVQKSGGSISALTAADMARKLTADLYSPITGQIDPVRVGEMQRAIRIAEHYGHRLGSRNLKPDAVQALVMDYPSHTSVIDIDEAGHLFENVRAPSNEERALEELFADVVRQPAREAHIINVSEELQKARTSGEDDARPGSEQDVGQDVPTSDGGRGEDGSTADASDRTGDRGGDGTASAPSQKSAASKRQRTEKDNSHASAQ